MRRRALTYALCLSASALAGAHCAAGNAAPPGAGSTGDAGPLDAAPLADARPSLGPARDAGWPLEGCATATANVLRDPVYMLLVVDGSGSMVNDSKWAAIVPAIEAFVDQLKTRGDPSLAVGLTLFSDVNDRTHGSGPYPAMDIPIAMVDESLAALVHARLDSTSPKEQTPTLAVLTGQYGAIEAFTPAPPLLLGGKKVLVLITDGVPYPDTANDQKPACIQAAKDEAAKGVITFAVGVGETFPYLPDTYDQVFMGNLAVAGGAPNEPCDPGELSQTSNMCHFQITPSAGESPLILEQGFLSAIDKIRSRVTSCDLALEATDGGVIDPHQVNVTFTTSVTGDRYVIPEGATDGWTYDDPVAPTKVILHGAACQALEDDPDALVQVVLGCKTIVK